MFSHLDAKKLLGFKTTFKSCKKNNNKLEILK